MSTYRDRLAEAIHLRECGCSRPAAECQPSARIADAVLAVPNPELERLRRERDMAINRSAGNVDLIGRLSYDRDTWRERAEKAEAELAAARAAIEKAREILPSFEGQITALIDDHPPLAETLSVTYRRLMFALSPAGGSEEAQDQCVRIDAEMPGEGPSCVTHNEPWPCPQAGQPAAPYGAIDPGPALDTPTPGDIP